MKFHHYWMKTVGLSGNENFAYGQIEAEGYNIIQPFLNGHIKHQNKYGA